MADFAELLQACEDQNCDGQWHECGNCGGHGWVDSPRDDATPGELERCQDCGTAGGRPCPLAAQEQRRD